MMNYKLLLIGILLVLVLVGMASATTTTVTFYTTNETDAMPARVSHNSTFTSLRNGAGTAASTDYYGLFADLEADSLTNGYFLLRRPAVIFNTSTLPDDSVIDSATLGLYRIGSSYSLGDTGIGITKYTGNASFFVDGYTKFNDDRFATDQNISVLNTTGYKNWSLNSIGISNISKISDSGFMVRTAWDIDNIDPTWISGQDAWVLFTAADNVANPPFLEVTYHTFVATPVSDFTVNKTSGLTPLIVQFTDTSTNVPTNWDWYWFANETKSSDDQNPTATFTTGQYNVRLYTSNTEGGDWENKTAYITVIPPGTVTFYTTNATDGSPSRHVHNSTFTDIRNGAGTAITPEWTGIMAYLGSDITTNNYTEMDRIALIFDTSPLPDDATINSAKIGLYRYQTETGLGDVGIGITKFNDGLITGAYSNFNNTRFATDQNLSTLNTNGYKNWSLNALGISNISLTSTSGFGVRTAWDIDNISPTWTSAGDTDVVFYSADYMAYTPFLEITYNSATTPAASFTSIQHNGTEEMTVQFNDTSTNNATAWNWSFTNVTPGNNTEIWFSTVQNPSKFFRVGNWSIRLNASNINGYSISSPQFINIGTSTGMQFFPSDSVWTTPINTLPVHPLSNTYITSMMNCIGVCPQSSETNTLSLFHWGLTPNVVDGTLNKTNLTFRYGSYMPAKAKVPYPIPDYREVWVGHGGGQPATTCTSDCHISIIDKDSRILYELFGMQYWTSTGNWTAGSGGVYDLSDYNLKNNGWAIASEMPMTPLLIRYDEMNSGTINHALKGYSPVVDNTNVWPAQSQGTTNNDAFPPYGLRFRLKSTFNTTGYPRQEKAILDALKTYGYFITDVGPQFFVDTSQDSRWNKPAMTINLSGVKGTDFEAVDESSLMINMDSMQVNGTSNVPVAHFYMNISSFGGYDLDTYYLAEHGVTGDGTDETTDLQNALNAATAGGYKKVSFPANKVILVSAPIYTGTYQEYIGNNCTIKVRDNTVPGGINFDYFYIYDGMWVHHLIFDANCLNQKVDGYGYRPWGGGTYGSSPPISASRGIRIKSHSIFEYNEVKNVATYAATIYSDHDTVVRYNSFHDNFQYGLALKSDGTLCNNISILNNTFYNNYQVGIKLAGGSNCLISGNTVTVPAHQVGNDDNPVGISLYSQDWPNTGMTITNNNVAGQIATTIGVDDQPVNDPGSVVSYNTISGAWRGIYIQFNGGTVNYNTITSASTCILDVGSGNTKIGNTCNGV